MAYGRSVDDLQAGSLWSIPLSDIVASFAPISEKSWRHRWIVVSAFSPVESNLQIVLVRVISALSMWVVISEQHLNI